MTTFCPCPNCGCQFESRRKEPTTIPPESQRLTELLSTNETPLEVDCKNILSLFDTVNNRSAQLGQQISRLEASLESLRDEQRRQDDISARCRAAVGAVRRIPTEIWRHIFVYSSEILQPCHYYDSDDFEFPPSSLDLTITPWTLTHVSHLWRQISIAHPTLWSTIVVSLPSQTIKQWSQLLAQVTRSGMDPIRLYLQTSGAIHGAEQIFNPFISILLSSSPRWQELHVHANNDLLGILEGVQGGFPSLLLANIIKCTAQKPTVPYNFLCSAQSLTRLVTRGPFHQTFQPPSQVIHWVNLPECGESEGFEQKPLTLKCAIDMLDALPLLTTADLSVGSYSFVSSDRMATHPNLATLTLNHMRPLKHLNLPSLQTFNMEHYVALNTIADFINRSSCSLTNLRLLALDSWSMGAVSLWDELNQIFPQTPALVTLAIGYVSEVDERPAVPDADFDDTDEEIVDILRQTTGDQLPRVLPRLNRLELYLPHLLGTRRSAMIQSLRPGLTIVESRRFPEL